MKKVARQPGVVAVGAVRASRRRSFTRTRHKSFRAGGRSKGIPPMARVCRKSRRFASTLTAGDFSFSTLDGKHRGAVLGTKLAERLNVVPGVDSISVFTHRREAIDPVTGCRCRAFRRSRSPGSSTRGCTSTTTSTSIVSLEAAQKLAQLGEAVTGLEVEDADAMGCARQSHGVWPTASACRSASSTGISRTTRCSTRSSSRSSA